MIGTLAVLGRRRRRRQTSIPLMPSIIQSSRTTSGFIFLGQDQRFFAVAGAGDGIAGTVEMEGDELGEGAVVLDQQQLLAASCRHSVADLPGLGSAMCSPVAA